MPYSCGIYWPAVLYADIVANNMADIETAA